jgi:hypothetical protein
MKMESTFEKDLSKGDFLGEYLDVLYSTIFEGCKIERVSDLPRQYKGIDVIITKDGKEEYIDEKAQLDYLRIDMPTNTFEISSLNKYGKEKIGWFIDDTKITDKYHIIANIFEKDKNDISKGFNFCKIYSVERRKLRNFLAERGLTTERLIEINNIIRSGGEVNSIGLDPETEGRFVYSKLNKSEKPINLQLDFSFLLREGLAIIIHR